MIIIDRALEAREAAGNPIRVGMAGAGFMGTAIARQIVRSTPGMRLVAIANRHPDSATAAFEQAGVRSIARAGSAAAIDAAVSRGAVAVTDDPEALCGADAVEAVLEVTGTVEYAARVVMAAVEHGKHLILMNAEVDATLGPLLKTYADRAGVVYTASDGDQPGVEMNLYRFVRGMGLTPLVCGNVKGFHDPYRTPSTQAEFAARWGQSPSMVTSFADGTKVSFEQAVVANATGMKVAQRGMGGRRVECHVDDLTGYYDADSLKAAGGIVDYVIGAKPAPGVFVLAALMDPEDRHFLELYKLGPGPLYSFYQPYHLCHLQTPASVARAVLFGDATAAPAGGPVAGVIAVAKRDLRRGEVIDGLGGYMTYGLCESHEVITRQALLPIGLAEGCRLMSDVAIDAALTWADVEAPPGRLSDRLWREQQRAFGQEALDT